MGESIAAIAATSIIGGAVNYITAQDSQKSNQAFNAAEGERNRQFSSEEAEKSRDWTAVQAKLQRDFENAQRLASQEYQSNEWTRQQEYLSPANQSQRLRAAGINPAVYFGGSSIATGSSVSAPSGSAPSIPSASPASVPSVPGSQGLPSLNFAESFRDVTEALHTAAKTNTEDLMRDPLYRQALESVVGQQFTNESIQLANKFQRLSLPDRVKEQFWKTMQAGMNVRLAQSDEDLKLAQTEYYQSMSALNASLKDKTGTEYLIFKNELATWSENYKTMINLRRSESAKNAAQAKESTQAASNLASEKKLKDLEYEIRRNVQGDIEDSYFVDLENKRKQGKIYDWQIDSAESAAKIARVAADHAEVLFWKDFIFDIFDHGVDAFTRFKNARSWERMSENQQRSVERKVEEMKWKYGDEVRLETPMSSGGKKVRTFKRPYSKYKDTTD